MITLEQLREGRIIDRLVDQFGFKLRTLGQTFMVRREFGEIVYQNDSSENVAIFLRGYKMGHEAAKAEQAERVKQEAAQTEEAEKARMAEETKLAKKGADKLIQLLVGEKPGRPTRKPRRS